MAITVESAAGRVADALDAGLIPWRLPSGMPRNVITGKFYGGVNPILLGIAAQGCSTPWWGTLKDWQALGGTIRPDSLGVRIQHCPAAIYNLEQTDRRYEPPALVDEDPEEFFNAIVDKLGVRMEFVYNATCKYVWDGDYIVMPHRWMFEIGPGGVLGYWDAKGHELMHWSERRTGWDGHPDVNELRAEIGTGYLGALAGAKPLPLHLARHHRRFAPRWARLLRQEPGLLVRVCDHVVSTLDYLLGHAGRTIDRHGGASC